MVGMAPVPLGQGQSWQTPRDISVPVPILSLSPSG